MDRRQDVGNQDAAEDDPGKGLRHRTGPGCIFLFTSSVITSPLGRMDCRRWPIHSGIELCSSETHNSGAAINSEKKGHEGKRSLHALLPYSASPTPVGSTDCSLDRRPGC